MAICPAAGQGLKGDLESYVDFPAEEISELMKNRCYRDTKKLGSRAPAVRNIHSTIPSKASFKPIESIWR